jgi:hypothetical protein
MPHNQPKRGGYLRVSQFSTALYPVTLFNRYLHLHPATDILHEGNLLWAFRISTVSSCLSPAPLTRFMIQTKSGF